VMKADKCTTRLTIASTVDPLSIQAKEAANECRKANYKFVSGHNGRVIVKAYTDIISNLDDTRWQQDRMTESEIVEAAFRALLPLAASWRRLVLCFIDPRFRLFAAVAMDDGETFVYNDSHVRDTIESLKRDGLRTVF